MRRARSIRFRIVAGVTLSLAAVLGGGSRVLVDQVEHRLIEEAEASLRRSLEELDFGDGNLAVPEESLLPVGDAGLLLQLVDDGTVVVAAIVDADGEPLGEITLDPTDGELVAIESFDDGALDGVDRDELVEVALDGVRTGETRTLAVTTTLASVRTSVQTLRDALWLIVPAMVVLGAVATWVWVGRSLRPVKAIGAAAAGIDANTLEGRVPVPDSHDEVERLARLVNRMLDRIEAGMEQQRQFVADASHELRTPLATVRAGAELFELTGDDRQASAAGDVMAEIDRMDALVGDLLVLARLDHGDQPVEPIDLRELVEGVVRSCSDPAVRLTGGVPVPVVGERRSLERMVRNVVDNARRHADHSVEVSVARGGDRALLAVENDGDGVEPADRERAFERFVRLDAGRSRDEGGSGLGLAIVAAVAQTHDGTARLTDRAAGAAGARVEIELPML